MIYFKWSVFLSLMSFAFFKGGMVGLFYGFLAFGIFSFLVYTIFDAGNSAMDAMSKTKVTNYNTQNTLQVETGTLKGQPDPTGPEAYPAVLEVRHERKSRG